ncbi:MAG: hypothetical protein AB7J19_12005 [Beijerinckiaceae bacterium]
MDEDEFARRFLGDNVQTGTMRLMAFIGLFILITGGFFAFLG